MSHDIVNENRIENIAARQRAGLRWQLAVATTLITGLLALLLGA